MVKNTKSPDSNLALISVILGGASIFAALLFITGIPAIILGSLALRKKVGNPSLAKLGIAFGVVGCLLTIPVVVLSVHFLRQPVHEQWGLTSEDSVKITELSNKLKDYKKTTGKYPLCDDGTDSTCPQWQTFVAQTSADVKFPVVFERDPSVVEDRPAGTLVYVNRSTCFVNTPTFPGTLDDNEKNKDETSFAALVYFHQKGRSCFRLEEH